MNWPLPPAPFNPEGSVKPTLSELVEKLEQGTLEAYEQGQWCTHGDALRALKKLVAEPPPVRFEQNRFRTAVADSIADFLNHQLFQAKIADAIASKLGIELYVEAQEFTDEHGRKWRRVE